ncbi:MAG: hypothetical protein EA403_11325 [Spirochaetaceae bacterium]|nr:MAG: hypothetical protein EA403_11325 [Spirochaetaceae bacterium]
MFSIDAEARDGIQILWLTDAASGSRAGVLPAVGATLWSLALQTVGEASNCDELLAGDPLSQINDNPWFRGRILFPFNDRIPEGRYRFGDRTYQLAINDRESGDAIHGMVHNQPFQVVDSQVDPDFARVVLRFGFDEGRFPGYPFAAELDVGYTLTRDRLEIAFTARNSGGRVCPVAVGMHPYVRTQPAVDAAALRCPSEAWVEVDERLLPTGALPATTGTPFDFEAFRSLSHRELDIGLLRGYAAERSQTAAAVTEVRRQTDTVVIEQDARGFPYTQLFIPPDRGSIAVEPITAATNSFNDGRLGLRVLAPGEEFEARYAVSRRANRE